jgi:hypothetical protein
MKQSVKQKLSRMGILPYLDIVLRTPSILRWVSGGCTGLAPAPVKRMVISSHLRRFSLHQFIETGTHLGDTLAYIAYNKNVECISIELADHYYEAAKKRFDRYRNVNLIHGDSGAVLPEYVQKLAKPALFWLDGHYSGGTTARGERDTPVNNELLAILNSPIKTHVILIDDARFFNGSDTYPHLEKLMKMVRSCKVYDIEVSADIIRVTPIDKS